MNEQILSSIVKTVQMGQSGIRCVQRKAVGVGLKKALQSQLEQYDAIEGRAYNLAGQKGWRVEPLNPSIQRMASMMTRMRLMGADPDSRIAGMLVQGNTKGMIKSLRDLHRAGRCDPQVVALAQDLVNHERNNIRQASEFL